ncbi:MULTISPECIES: aldose epimerase family protein [unclassified Streptomyces]|uniref:aldose epimerase family protein n=1 Tax=unclassified Streptomyces TaxID=2593676 RepID=UPI0021560824|nr:MULTISPECIES: aldose epimerase family protein [unclassified Streptomyces]
MTADGVGEGFGEDRGGTAVHRHTLRAPGIRVRVLTYGCVVQSLEVPDAAGEFGDVVIGLDTMEDYLTRSRYFGAVVGRYGNRVAGASFTLDGREYALPANNGEASLHGGPGGFSNRVWQVTDIAEDRITLARTSEDGEEGYPGQLRAEVTYRVASGPDGADLRIDYLATTDAPTHVNLTNHSYFNLDGGPDIHDHTVTLDAGQYLPVDEGFIPTGELAPTAGTPFDFTTGHTVGSRLGDGHPQLKAAGGYDHCMVFDSPAGTLRSVARVTGPRSGRAMEVLTTEPGVQFYAGGKLADHVYGPGSGLCLETQHFPDSPNRPEFPSTVLRPGTEYRSSTVYRFSAAAGNAPELSGGGPEGERAWR